MFYNSMSEPLYHPNLEKKQAVSLFRILYKHRKLFLFVAVLSFCLSILVTYLTPNKYYSYGIVFATNSYQSANILENPQFGFEHDAEQLMQLLESEALRAEIVNQFALVKYYEIDTTSPYWEEDLVKYYIEDVNFFRSKYTSIVISATTKDPVLSANIVNTIIQKVNEYKESIFRTNRSQDYEYKKLAYEQQVKTMDRLTRKLYEIKKPEGAKDLIYNHFLMTSKENAPAETYTYVNSVQLEDMIREYKYQNYRLEILKDEFIKAEYVFNRPTQKNYVIDTAKPQFKRTSPSFTINSVVGISCSLLLTILFLGIRSKFQEVLALARQE